jgi:RNA polymerase sigma factor for flagellar operon FliA
MIAISPVQDRGWGGRAAPLKPTQPVANVLIIHQTEIIRLGLSTMLSGGAACEVASAASVYEAFRLASDVHPQLVLLDFTPTEGAEVCRLVSALWPRPRIIALASRGRGVEPNDCLAVGADAVILVDNVSRGAFLGVVRQVMDGLGPIVAGFPAAEGQQVAPAGSGLSRDELVQRYAHLVKYVVGRLGVSVPGLFDHEDAMQAGVLGLLRAIDGYRPEAAASFESYAILRIRGAILDAVRSLDSVGRAGREAARAIQGAICDLQNEFGRSPTETEVAGRLDMSVTRYRERLQAASFVTVSLDEHEPRDNDDEQPVLAENVPDPRALDPAEEATRRDAVACLVHEMGRLHARSRMVLALYYQDEMTFKEIGQVLGVTESRVCQIHTEAILALRGRLVEPDVAARLGRRRARS